MFSINWQKIDQLLSDTHGKSLNLRQAKSVGGGCINQAWKVESELGLLFIKINQADYLQMFAAEFAGLEEIARSKTIRVPQPYQVGLSDQHAFIAMEFLHLAHLDPAAETRFAERLAAMHRRTQADFGWYRDNTIGVTRQINTATGNWIDFYRQHRLGFQLRLAADNGAGRRLIQKGELLMPRLEQFFDSYQPSPSLLHGDLWAGNGSADVKGQPVIYDPAVYYGDREADIAMTELFGGFSSHFYAAYNRAWPLDSGYRLRKTLYNLYHILNHFNLFGGSYANQAEVMIEQLLKHN